MAPESASSQPPSEPTDIAPQDGGSNVQLTRKEHEVYGPLDIERHIKDDGRALILYAIRNGGET